VLERSPGYVHGLLRLPCSAGALGLTLPPAFTPRMALIVRPCGIFQGRGGAPKSRRMAACLIGAERGRDEEPRPLFRFDARFTARHENLTT